MSAQIPVDKVRIAKYADVTGNSLRAIESKIQRGDWAEGRQYFRAPDGAIYISIKGVERWVEGKEAA